MTVNDRIKQYVAENFLADDDAQIPADLDLLGSGVIDSLGMLKLISWIESAFDIKIDDTDLDPENFRTVSTVSNLVTKAQGATTAS